MCSHQSLKNILAINHLTEIKQDEREALCEWSRQTDLSLAQDYKQLSSIHLSEEVLRQIRSFDWEIVEEELNWSEKNNHSILTIDDERYPNLLREISSPPIVLFVKGHAEILSVPQLAIVGSRNPTPMGRETAEQFASYLSKSGLVITSGLATGIDGASHRGALKTGQTIAVMGTGIENVYPKQHQSLAEQVIEKGALISEFPLHEPGKPINFPRRNRIISGLSLGVLVVEAAIRSGSLITAHRAIEQGREVFAIPGSIHNPLARGCHQLIREGAKLVEKAQDIMDELGSLYNFAILENKKNASESLDEDYKKLLSCVGFESTAIDTILMRSGFSAKEVSSMLLILELKGYISSVSGGYCRKK